MKEILTIIAVVVLAIAISHTIGISEKPLTDAAFGMKWTNEH